MLTGIDDRARLTALKETIARGLLVHLRSPDADARFRRGLGAGWPLPVMREPGEYGYHEAWLKKGASPAEVSEKDLVMEWLAWLRRQPGEGDLAIRRIIGWVGGTPLCYLGLRERCSSRTIFNRIDRSCSMILMEFFSVAVAVETVNEPPDRQGAYSMSFTERPTKAGSLDSFFPSKVYIDGIGVMFEGAAVEPALRRQAARGRRRHI